MKPEEKKLTPRQWWLYRFLLEANGKDPSRWFSAQEIADAIALDLTYGYGDAYRISESKKAHNPCPALWEDVEAINASLHVDKFIIYDNYRIKFPKSRSEAKPYLDDLERRGKKILSRCYRAYRKLYRDGQGKLLPSKKRFVEAMVGGWGDEG